ncbi:MAG: hypothetical protein MJ252_23085 [archaeon]|nr:hypothetical protein [archaeon]
MNSFVNPENQKHIMIVRKQMKNKKQTPITLYSNINQPQIIKKSEVSKLASNYKSIGERIQRIEKLKQKLSVKTNISGKPVQNTFLSTQGKMTQISQNSQISNSNFSSFANRNSMVNFSTRNIINNPKLNNNSVLSVNKIPPNSFAVFSQTNIHNNLNNNPVSNRRNTEVLEPTVIKVNNNKSNIYDKRMLNYPSFQGPSGPKLAKRLSELKSPKESSKNTSTSKVENKQRIKIIRNTFSFNGRRKETSKDQKELKPIGRHKHTESVLPKKMSLINSKETKDLFGNSFLSNGKINENKVPRHNKKGLSQDMISHRPRDLSKTNLHNYRETEPKEEKLIKEKKSNSKSKPKPAKLNDRNYNKSCINIRKDFKIENNNKTFRKNNKENNKSVNINKNNNGQSCIRKTIEPSPIKKSNITSKSHSKSKTNRISNKDTLVLKDNCQIKINLNKILRDIKVDKKKPKPNITSSNKSYSKSKNIPQKNKPTKANKISNIPYRPKQNNKPKELEVKRLSVGNLPEVEKINSSQPNEIIPDTKINEILNSEKKENKNSEQNETEKTNSENYFEDNFNNIILDSNTKKKEENENVDNSIFDLQSNFTDGDYDDFDDLNAIVRKLDFNFNVNNTDDYFSEESKIRKDFGKNFLTRFEGILGFNSDKRNNKENKKPILVSNSKFSDQKNLNNFSMCTQDTSCKKNMTAPKILGMSSGK